MTGYCKWCDTLTDDVVTVSKKGRLIWIGCISCYAKEEKEKQRAEE